MFLLRTFSSSNDHCRLQRYNYSFLLGKPEQLIIHSKTRATHNVILHSFSKQGGAIPPGLALDLENKLILQAFKETAF